MRFSAADQDIATDGPNASGVEDAPASGRPRKRVDFAGTGIESSASGGVRGKVQQRWDIPTKGGIMLTTILIIILILILLGAFPAWPHSRGWGYGPSGVVGLILVILLILLLLGKI